MARETVLVTAISELLDDVHNGLPPTVAMPRLEELLADHEAETSRLRAALEEIDNLDPDDFKIGQRHLGVAFREVDFACVVRKITQIVNRTLHGTDEHGQPLAEEGSTDVPS